MNWRPVAPAELPGTLAGWLSAQPGLLRVAVDGAPCTVPDGLAGDLVAPLQAAGRPVAHVRAAAFWRDAALRLEHGREDAESYLTWLDADALRREVLVPAVEHGRYLPSLRDPATNRSTREPPRPLAPGTVLLASGSLLLGLGLPFDRVVHLTMSPAALARRTDPAQAWTLPAFATYEATVHPVEIADLTIKLDDPRHPALHQRDRPRRPGDAPPPS